MIVKDWANIIRMECGLVNEDNIFDFSSYRQTSRESDGDLIQATEFTKVNKGLGAIFNISKDLRDLINTFRRLKHRNEQSGENSNNERSFARALPCLRNIWSRLHLPDYIVNSSARIYRKCIRKELINGKSIEGMALAAIKYSCLKEGFDADLSVVADDLGVTAQKLDEYVEVIRNTRTISRSPTVPEYMRGVMSALDLPVETRERATDIFKHVVARRLEVGHHPGAVAGAIIWCAANMGNGKRISQAEVAKLANVSQTTIKRFVILVRS